MKISIGSDHRGTVQKQQVKSAIESAGHEVDDRGTHSTESCDYPDVAAEVATAVASGRSDRGILICGSGIGMSIAANKVKGIRAALCCNLESAILSRQHNDANVLCLASESFNESGLNDVVTQWLATEFEGGRHARRVDKIKAIEQQATTVTGS